MTIVYRSDGNSITNAVMDKNFEQLSNRYSGEDIAASATFTPVVGYTYFTISGATNITKISDVSIGHRLAIKFTEAGGDIGHSTALIMPGSTTITWRAGDIAIFVNESTGVWRCVSYQRGDISPMGAALKSAGDNSTNAASTAYVDAYDADAHKAWELHDTFTASGSTELGETTSIPSDAVAIRVLARNLGTTTTDLVWWPGILLGYSSGTYETAIWDNYWGQTNDSPAFEDDFFPLSDSGTGGDTDVLSSFVELWNIQGTDIWVGYSQSAETDDNEIFATCGRCNLSGTLDSLKITSDNSPSTVQGFDNGTAEIWVLR